MVGEIKKIDLQEFAPKESEDSIEDSAKQKKKTFLSDVKKELDGKNKKKFKLKLGKAKYFFILLIVFLFLVLAVSILAVVLARPVISSAQKTYALTQEAYEAGKNQDIVASGDKLKGAENSLRETQDQYKKLAWLKAVPIISQYYKDGEKGLNAGLNGIQAGVVLIDAITPYADVLGFEGQGTFMGGTAEDRIMKIVQTLEKVTPKIDEVAEKLSKAQAELGEINPQRYPETIKGKQVRNNIINAKTILLDISSSIAEAKPILNVLPQILGHPESKKYLVIFQNDGELRATGGFMTAFSVLHIESGKVKTEKSDDIYSLDKKFRSRLKAPDPIKEYLFSADLGTGVVPYFYLRDMNFSPDFKTSMDTFKQYYDKLPGEYEVDGIITVDTYVLKDLVDILGPIDVPGYGNFTNEPDERCHNISNIICELEYIVDQPLPTHIGNRKKTILGPMMQEIMSKAMGSGKNIWPKLFSTGLKLLKEKHVLSYFVDEEIQGAVEAFGAAGRIKEFEGDYLHINDSNFGGAKSNIFTKHKIEQEIEISENGRVSKILTLVYENEEKVDNCNLERASGLCLNSILRNYLRIYVPEGSKLIESLGSEVEMETKEELGKTYFDGFFTVRGDGGRAKVVIKYELPFNINSGGNYKLLIQKQPGTLGHEYKITFGDKEEEFDLKTDREFEFEF